MQKYEKLLSFFGGSLKLAYELDVHQQTVESWKKRGGIPEHPYWEQIIKVSKGKFDAKFLHELNKEVRNNAEQERSS